MDYGNNFGNDQHRERGHWEKYKIYYLVFGIFFLLTLFLAIGIYNFSSGTSKSDLSLKIDRYLRRLEKEPFPSYVKERVKEEIKKGFLRGQTSENREEWVDQVMAFPWWEISPENSDLAKVRKVLNESHFGMDKVKEPIIEYLAAKKQVGKSFGKVICLVGPAGTGKTSIAESIAKALGRSFERISLGGVHDEGEIRGHRNTYVSAKPGKIVKAFQKVGVKNPVISLDEIEKMGKSEQHGDPAAAFLEIFDPEQNNKFQDHYIELPIDLSQAMFICTVNQIETISGPLRDRMEIIEIPSYISSDKLAIAKDHLIPKLSKKYNLTKGELTFKDEAIQKIIDHYTWEPGVRKLTEKLEKIFSKFAVKIAVKKAEEELQNENITLDKVKEYLGKPSIPDLDVQVDYDKFGVVNGLGVYNSEMGGSVLPIEVILSPLGKEELIFTGNLKETMEQSVKVAINYVKNNFSDFSIVNLDKLEEKLKGKDIHVHVPRGGIPKDGPSAGTAFVTAIASILTEKKISEKIAMTGEITLNGKILPVGGIKEKIYAAYRTKKIKKVFIPLSNKSDSEDISPEIKEDTSFEIILVENYQDIWKEL